MYTSIQIGTQVKKNTKQNNTLNAFIIGKKLKISNIYKNRENNLFLCI